MVKRMLVISPAKRKALRADKKKEKKKKKIKRILSCQRKKENLSHSGSGVF